MVDPQGSVADSQLTGGDPQFYLAAHHLLVFLDGSLEILVEWAKVLDGPGKALGLASVTHWQNRDRQAIELGDPTLPRRSAFQNVFKSRPSGLTTPSPVITTRV